MKEDSWTSIVVE